MASRVDLPQPDGPAIDRYSPFLTSKWMPERACVSTSSVTKTLLTLSSRMRACESLSISSPYYVYGGNLVQLYAVVIVVRRHIGEDHPVPNPQTVLDFDRVDGAAPERHLDL